MSPKWDSLSQYRPKEFESTLQDEWEINALFAAENRSVKPKYYCLDFFPYPSGDGLHVGHCRNYIPTDVVSRFKRMNGDNVLHPMGWDSFGEPTEHYAVTHGIHPRQSTDQNTANFRRQMRMIGTSYDWSREIDSSKPEYYRWTQYFFLLFYRRGLAYRSKNWQWWCPVCQTTLSGQEVSDGVCWRGHEGVYRKEISTWFFRITEYAEELLDSLEKLDWPERIKIMQRNWIGRSEGCEIWFKTDWEEILPVFTTRPDTLFGSTFLALAPEHPLVGRLTADDQRVVVDQYVTQAGSKSEIDRMSDTGIKTGVFTGSYVSNPVNGDRLPVWVVDYVLPGYGTGAVMGVPAHDQRDYEFAIKYNLPVKVVVEDPASSDSVQEWAYTGEGKLRNSDRFSGLQSADAGIRICEFLEKNGSGKFSVIYRMHDWVISRQRYWGTPIPIVYCSDCGVVPVPESELPVELPKLDDFRPDGSGRSPLARVPEFFHATCPECGGEAHRETDTMGGFACSAWYFLRFTSPHHDEGPFESKSMQYWMPVDLYVGGAEHAVLHLLYARFWTMALADEGLLNFREPFTKLMNQGQLLAPDGQRMSKSSGNVITPDQIVNLYGADALRIYEMFMAPFDQDISWNTDGINGAFRFLKRVWRLYRDTYSASAGSTGYDPELEKKLHKTIKLVTERIEAFKFNTMISALMEFVNELYAKYLGGHWVNHTYHSCLETFLVLLSPSAPYISDYLWKQTRHAGSVHEQAWPEWNENLIVDQFVEIAVQIDGKFRDLIEVPIDESEQFVFETAMDRERIKQHLSGETVLKKHYVPGRVINLVTG